VGGWRRVPGPGGWQRGLTSLGRLTGLVASDLLLVQMLLMARVPQLERAFGQDQLARHHRVVGFTSFNLMVVHVVLITWGYAAGQLGPTPATFWDLITDYPGMLLALAGTACLVMTVATSLRAARGRLRYESWHLLHLYAYLGVGLALPHQLWTGQEFLASTAATVFWWSLWALAAGAVLVWRVGLPLWRNARTRLHVTAVVPEAAEVVSVHLTGRHLDRLPAQAGQFLTWRFLHRQGWTRGNPYSLSAAPDGRGLRITVKELGDNSAQLRALAEGLEYAPGDAVLLHRFTHRPLFERELHQLTIKRGLQVLWLPGHRRASDSWLGAGVDAADDVTALTWWVPDLAERDVYVCGPEDWIETVRRVTQAAGLPADQLHIEKFRW